MQREIQIGDITASLFFKDIRNVHLSVHPPAGRVTISAPVRMSVDTIRIFAISRLPWIRKQRRKLQEQERETPREYLDRESHYVWGKRYLLKILESDQPTAIELGHSRLVLNVRPGTDRVRKRELLEDWYREQVRQAVPALLSAWERKIGVEVQKVYVRRMKTRWGSCNNRARSIRLNTDLAKKPPECLEYLVVHEMIHILEPTHSARFIELMDRFMPKWRMHRDVLNRLPVRHEEWGY
jgi:predicted metal-dependent hydrolase